VPKSTPLKTILLFASGNGSNAENIVRHFQQSKQVKVSALFCNNPKAGVIQRMEKLGVAVHQFNRETFLNSSLFLPLIESYKPDLIVLAGFLWLLPEYLVKAYANRIINIHPALLPGYGGKGMYGHHVHEAVLKNKEKEHGITIHFVNEKYDDGQVIFQAKFEVKPEMNLEAVSKAISSLEMQYFPEAIERVLGLK
jgi:phosphoribosylglycinamide formyltransferase-1